MTTKANLVELAVSKGLARDEAEGMTKAELAERFDVDDGMSEAPQARPFEEASEGVPRFNHGRSGEDQETRLANSSDYKVK